MRGFKGSEVVRGADPQRLLDTQNPYPSCVRCLTRTGDLVQRMAMMQDELMGACVWYIACGNKT